MKEAGKQVCRSLLTGMVLLAGLTFLLVSSSYASVPPAEQFGKIATVEHILHQTQSSIWQQLHSQEVDALVSQLRMAEKAGRDDQAGQLRRQLNQLEKRLLGDAPPADAELARLVQKKKMLLDELARLGGGTQAAASSAVAAAALTAGTSTITGKVTNSGGNAIAEAYVLVVDSSGNGESRTTDAAGVYTVANIAAGIYYVYFSADGYEAEWYEDAPQQACATPVTLAADKSETIDAVLEKTAVVETGSISGKVTDPDGTAVSGAYVYAYGPDYGSTSTGADGTYTISGLPSGDYKVEFNAPFSSDLLDEWYNGKADYSSADAVTVTAPDTKSGIDATLAKGGSITGTVKDGSNSDAPLSGAYVYAYLCDNASCDSYSSAGYDYTATDGTYTISGLPTGSYKVKFTVAYRSNGIEGWTATGLIDEWYNDKADSNSADVVAVTAPNNKTGIDATVAKGGSISGTVKDGSNSDAPLSGAYVYAYLCDNASCDSYSSAGYDYTATDGTYTISGLPTGSYKVKFTVAYRSNGIEGWTATGLIDEWYNDKADSNSADVVAVTAPNNKAGIDATVAKGGSITGKVIDSAATPAVVSGARVYAYESIVSSTGTYVHVTPYSSATTDENGEYTISGLPTGSYKVKFEAPYDSGLLDEWYNGKADSSSAGAVAVAAPDTKSGIDATLAKGGSITGTVTNDGAAFKCAYVSVREVDGYCYEYEGGGEYCYYPTIGSAVTDYQGKYTVKGLSGSYKVYVSGETSTGDSLWQWYKGRMEGRCANKIGVTAPNATTLDVAFPVQLRQCGGSLIPILKFLLN
ncbi:hypothetical protein GCAAIG_07955 [Candidatus Electronema halotolerans]